MVILILIGLAIGMLNELNQFAALLILGPTILTRLQQLSRKPLPRCSSIYINIGFTIAHVSGVFGSSPMGYLIFGSGFLAQQSWASG